MSHAPFPIKRDSLQKGIFKGYKKYKSMQNLFAQNSQWKLTRWPVQDFPLPGIAQWALWGLVTRERERMLNLRRQRQKSNDIVMNEWRNNWKNFWVAVVPSIIRCPASNAGAFVVISLSFHYLYDINSFQKLNGSTHPIPKWLPINYSFVCMLIIPLRLIFTSKFFCFLCMLTRRRGLINMQAKE